MINSDTTGPEVLGHLLRYYEKAQDNNSAYIQHLLSESECDFQYIEGSKHGYWDAYTGPIYRVTLYLKVDKVAKANDDWFKDGIKTAMSVFIEEELKATMEIRVKALVPAENKTVGLNNCFFKTEKTITHDELRFRSRGEIAIYEELIRRDVLVFPNPGAIFGTTKVGEKPEKKEPDFLVCQKGKWGILEINGDDFHTGIIQTAKDHDRARRFNHYGVFFIQAYALNRCKNQPAKVVDEFLRLLEQHK